MKKIIYGALLCAIATTMQAKIESNKTFIRARDVHSNNILMALAGKTWRKGRENNIGSTISGSAFYRTSYNTQEIAANVGGGQSVNNDQSGRLEIQYGESPNTQSEAYSLYSSAIDHMSTTGTTTGMWGTLTLNPSRTEVGTYISWQQDLSFLMSNTSLHIDLPVVRVTHNLDTTFAGTAHASSETTSGQAGSTLQNYFSGRTLAKTALASQQALQYMRIDGSAHNITGVADIRIGLNYSFFNNRTFRINTKAHITIPTNGTTTAVNLFEPTLGSGHVAAGFAGTMLVNIFRSEDKSHKMSGVASLDYRYLFQGEKIRTLGLYNFWYKTIATGSQYRTIGLAGGDIAIPAANQLTRKVLVKPGQVFDGVLGARYNYKAFGISLLYNLHAHENETVTLAPKSKWFDGTYGLLGHGFNLASEGGIVIGSTNTYGGIIQQEGNTTSYLKDSGGSATATDLAQNYITTNACSGRNDITHKLAAVGEWHYREFRFPINISAGAEYEMAGLTNSNNGIHSWALWGKLSMCF